MHVDLPKQERGSRRDTLVAVDRLSKAFDVSKSALNRLVERSGKKYLRAVDGVSFEIERGTTLGLVGESGCGKSTVARCVVGLYPPSDGKICFDGVALSDVKGRKEVRQMRRRLQMVFQDPYASLNPRRSVAEIIGEPLRAFSLVSNRRQMRERVDELLVQVGLSAGDGDKYPHEFSGGQRQRISIARALASRPDFIVCDEPTSALDVSVQAQILNLMRDLQEKYNLTYLLISHNLAVVYNVADKVGVMYLGQLVELGETETLFRSPKHPYTRMLLDSVPDLEMTGRQRQHVTGEIPDPINPPPGCAFNPRCPFANQRCRDERPRAITAPDGVRVACHAVEEGRLPLEKVAVPTA